MLWLVTVEGTDRAGPGDVQTFDTIVLAHSERGARSSATRAVKRLGLGLVAVTSTDIAALAVRETGVVLITNRSGEPLFVKEMNE